MIGSARRPLLFLDVDGPLIPFGANAQELPDGYPTYPGPPSGPGAAADDDANPLLSRIDPALGPRLLALPCDLVWATTWLDEANEAVGPRLGLPELPVLDWPDDPSGPDGPKGTDGTDGTSGLHWKTRAIVEWASGRDLVWVDDEIGDVDREWMAAHHPGHALLRRVDARRGLTGADFAAIEVWCRGRTGRP
ncbi:hypothetical protein [Streptomyces sp. NPDC059009]|uniref:hypothetical protein n=1 Tax=Streptomyces sp. NPDC059009 TaxID=3346694 RepID=UPI0036C63623